MPPPFPPKAPKYKTVLGSSDSKGPLRMSTTAPVRVNALPLATPDPELIPTSLASLAELAPVDTGLRCVPPTAHFSAWASQEGGTTRVTLRVINHTSTPQRILIDRKVVGDREHPGDEAAFWVDVVQGGAVPPGLSQAFTVTFAPAAGPRYYHARVAAIGESGTLLIPLHAYPVPTGLTLPRFLDCGTVPLGGEVVKQLSLATSVPLPFSVTLQPLAPPNPRDGGWGDIHVHPLAITIPPRGTAAFTVRYTPTSLTTATAHFTWVTSTHAPGLENNLEEDLAP